MSRTESTETTSTVRVLHHLGSTGGTVMSRAIAGIPRVVLISEINPQHRSDRANARFYPTDVIGKLSSIEGLVSPENRSRHFIAQITLALEIARAADRAVVLREHSHSMFFRNEFESVIRMELLQAGLALQSVGTVRHPLDSFLSARSSRYLGSNPGFDHHCRRHLSFFDYLVEKQIAWFRYEDFCAVPERVIPKMAAALHLSDADIDVHHLEKVPLSGDSGRLRGQMASIQTLPRRQVDKVLLREVVESTAYEAFCDRAGYRPECDSPALNAVLE
jgi:hypothetical protein